MLLDYKIVSFVVVRPYGFFFQKHTKFVIVGHQITGTAAAASGS